MANDVGIVWEGAPQFAADMRRLSSRIETDNVAALEQVARQLVPRVRSLMPKLTGRLAGSVAVETDAESASVTASTDYAGWIEYGGTRGRPYLAGGRYLEPTVAQSGPTVQERLGRATQNTIGGFPWSHTS
jgi:hypothetical protein